MARTGVTQADVSDAADQLVAAGERPTTERVRLRLGRGSPNTVGPMLEQWWNDLAERLQGRLALPELPETVAAAFAETWALARRRPGRRMPKAWWRPSAPPWPRCWPMPRRSLPSTATT